MMTRVMSESPVSPSSLSVPVQTILCGQGAQSYFPMGTHPKISTGAANFLRFGSLSLNPHAEEFVPSSLKVESTHSEGFPSLIKSTNISPESYRERNFSHSEYRQYVFSQLPDDILPDFSYTTEDGNEGEQFHASTVDLGTNKIHIGQLNIESELGYVKNMEQRLCQPSLTLKASVEGTSNYISYNDTKGTSLVFTPQQSALINQLSSSQGAMRPALVNDLGVAFYNDIASRPIVNNLGSALSQSINVPASMFPCIAVENLADKFSSNCDHAGLTLNTLTQLELQEGTISRQPQLSAAAAPYMSAPNTSLPSIFKAVTQQSRHLEDANDRPLNLDGHVSFSSSYLQCNDIRGMGVFSGSVKPSHPSGEGSLILESKATGHGVHQNGEREFLTRKQRAWTEVGDAVVNNFMEKQDKGPDYARMSSVYYEHVRQAHLTGKLMQAKELNAKDQSYLEQVKREAFKGSDMSGRQNSCFVNMGHTTHYSLQRPGNVFIH